MDKLLVQEWMRTDVITINPELRVERAINAAHAMTGATFSWISTGTRI